MRQGQFDDVTHRFGRTDRQRLGLFSQSNETIQKLIGTAQFLVWNKLKTYVSNGLDGVVVGDLNGRRFRLFIAFVFNGLAQPIPPEIAQRRRTVNRHN